MNPDRERIVVVGSYMRDMVLRASALPRPGETCVASHVAFGHGGKGSNQAVQAARCGARVTLVAAIGEDGPGQAARAFWASEGIDHAGAVCIADDDTGTAVVVVDDRGENQIVVAPGANRSLAPHHVDRCAASIAAAAVVVAQLETPIEATIAAFELAGRAGALRILNAAPLGAPARLAPALAVTDLLVCNLGEAQGVLGDDDGDPARLARRLAEQVRRATLVTAGGDGAFLYDHAGRAMIHQAAVPGVQVVDTTGAGDAFLGAFACRWGETRDWRESLRFGAGAGAIACEHPGAAAALGARRDITTRLAS